MWLTGPTLMLGRFLLGFGGGFTNIAVPIFISETVPAEMMSIIGTATAGGASFAMIF